MCFKTLEFNNEESIFSKKFDLHLGVIETKIIENFFCCFHDYFFGTIVALVLIGVV